MSRVGVAFARLSKREKIMVVVLGVAVVGGLLFFLNGMFQSKITKLETDIANERDSLRQIYAGTEIYKVAAARFEASRTQAIENEKLTLTTAVANLAGDISFDATDTRNNPMGKKNLKEFLEFAALKEKPVGNRSKSTKDKSEEGYVQRDQEFTLKGTVPFAAIYQLFEKIEESSDLLFVTEMRMERNSADSDRADNVKFTVSTFYFQQENEEDMP
jgi:hypothetical protein